MAVQFVHEYLKERQKASKKLQDLCFVKGDRHAPPQELRPLPDHMPLAGRSGHRPGSGTKADRVLHRLRGEPGKRIEIENYDALPVDLLSVTAKTP
jgi:hypothetical protein